MPAAARILMTAAWFCFSVWAAGVVLQRMGEPCWCGCTWRPWHAPSPSAEKRPVLWRASWGVPALLLAYYLFIPATNDKEWQPSWSRLPSVEINGNEIVVKDVRSFIYRTERDFDARYVTRRFDLDKLATLDFCREPLGWDGIRGPYHVVLRF